MRNQFRTYDKRVWKKLVLGCTFGLNGHVFRFGGHATVDRIGWPEADIVLHLGPIFVSVFAMWCEKIEK